VSLLHERKLELQTRIQCLQSAADSRGGRARVNSASDAMDSASEAQVAEPPGRLEGKNDLMHDPGALPRVIEGSPSGSRQQEVSWPCQAQPGSLGWASSATQRNPQVRGTGFQPVAGVCHGIPQACLLLLSPWSYSFRAWQGWVMHLCSTHLALFTASVRMTGCMPPEISI
jgi:hypothetical protein